jgi:hypothetical protein
VKDLLPLGCFDLTLCVTTPQDRIELATATKKASSEYIAFAKTVWSSILHVKKGNAAGLSTRINQAALR